MKTSEEKRVDKILEDFMWEGYEKINQKKEVTDTATTTFKEHLPLLYCPSPTMTVSFCPTCYKKMEREIIDYYKESAEFEADAEEYARSNFWKEPD